MFQILDIPFTAVGFTVTDDAGTIRTASTINPAAVILPEIETFITGGTTPTGIVYPPINPGILAQVLVYVNRWIALGTRTSKISTGNVGDLSQVTNDPKEERQLIREFIRGAIPFWTRYAYLLKQSGDGVSSSPAGGGRTSIPFVR